MAAPESCPSYDPDKVDSEAMLRGISTMADTRWHTVTAHGFCGGCGNDDCHPGRCCTEERDLLNVMESVCGLCPERVATGQRREVTW